MAVTATATHSTLKDISESLNLRADCQIIRESFNRPNLFYKVQPRPSKGLMVEVVKWIQDRHSHHTGIIYCHGKEGCEKAAISLREQGLNARHYHAGRTRSLCSQPKIALSCGRPIVSGENTSSRGMEVGRMRDSRCYSELRVPIYPEVI